jgi:hypothetical protein
MIFISNYDKNGRIIINPLKEANPRQAFIEFDNMKTMDVIKRDMKKKDDDIAQEDDNKVESNNKSIIYMQFLTSHRAFVMIATVIGILAVDFPVIFPRRFCKTEEYGVSLVRAKVNFNILE